MRLLEEDKQLRDFVIEQNKRHRNRQIVRLLLFVIGFLFVAWFIESVVLGLCPWASGDPVSIIDGIVRGIVDGALCYSDGPLP